jgi:uncharacterized protein (TIGR03067 family)
MTPIALLAVAVVVGAPLPKERPKPLPSIVGDWVTQSRTFAGTVRPIAGEPLRYAFAEDGTYGVYRGPGRLVDDRKYTTDLKKDPAGVDLDTDADGGRVYRGIFKVEGDTLTVCWGNVDQPRPAGFESSSTKPTTVYVFQRVKKE